MSKDTKPAQKGDELVTKSYLTEVLDERFEKFEQKIDAKFDLLAGIVKRQFDHIDLRFMELEKRFDAFEGRFDALEGRFDALERKVDGIHSFLYRHVEQSDQRFMETNSTVRLHDQWIKKASRKVGVPYPLSVSHRR